MPCLTYFDFHQNLTIADMLAAVGVNRLTCQGGAPTAAGNVRSEYRCNVARNGVTFDFDAGEAARLATAFAKLRSAA